MTAVQQFTEDQRDCLQEVVNVAMGSAGDSLARFLEVFVSLSIPQVRLVHASDLRHEVADLVGELESVSAVRQGFHTRNDAKGVRGEAIVVFSDASFKVLAELLAYDEQALNDHVERELLLDISNVLTGACLKGFGEQIESDLTFSAPTIMGQHLSVERLLDVGGYQWGQALLVEINYTLEDKSLKCNLLTLLPGDAIEVVRGQLDKLLEDL